jgi:zinc-ribbon domain
MICPRCQANMADNVTFCTNCGTQFGTAGQRPQGNSDATQQAQPGYPQQGQPGYQQQGQPGYQQQGQPTHSQPGPNQPGYNQPGYSQPGYAPQGQPTYYQPGYAPQGQSSYSQPAQPGYSPQGQQPGYGPPGQQPRHSQPGQQPGYRPPAGPPQHGPQFAFDLNRLSRVDQVVGASSLILIITLFLPWFGVSLDGYSASESGFDAHGYLIIPLLTAIVLIAYLVMRAGWDHLPWKLPIEHAPLLLVGTGIQALIVLLAFLFKPAGTAWQFGAYLGLLAALVACGASLMPALNSMQGGTTAR